MDANTVTALGTVILAVVTAVLAIFTYKLWSATKTMALNTLQTTRSQLRAYMFIDGFKYLSHLNPQSGQVWWSIQAILKNGGSTPAISALTMLKNGQNGINDFDIATNEQELSGQALASCGPNSTIASGYIVVNGTDLLEVANGKMKLFLVGIISYKTVFEEIKRQTIKYCYEVDKVLGDPTKEYNEQTNIVELHFRVHSIETE